MTLPLRIRQIELTDYSRFFFELNLNSVDTVGELASHYRELYRIIAGKNIDMLYEKIFGRLSSKDYLLKERSKIADELELDLPPLAYIEGAPVEGGHISAVQIYGIYRKAKDICINYYTNGEHNQTISAKVETKESSFLYLFGLHDGLVENNGSSTFATLYNSLEQHIIQSGFSFDQIVRSWIYLSNIKEHYVDFNQARNDMFKRYNIDYGPFSNALPASTCIEGKAANSTEMDIDAICVAPNKKKPAVNRIFNRLQNEADGSTYMYKPAFSRGMLIEDDEYREIQISGTASIGTNGKTEYQGDPYQQIKKTLINVRELIRPFDMDYSDICQSTCFFKDASHYRYFYDAIEDLDIKSDFMNTFVIGNVCREDLLFEIDGIAVKKKS